MRRLFLAFLFLFIASPAVASTPGQWDVGQQPITYPLIGPSGIFTEQLGDGSDPHGGKPPFFANQPADIPSTVTTQVTEGTGIGSTTGNDEFKLRLTLLTSHVLPDDPLRNHCQRGASHLHEFAGAIASGACSTFQQLRNDCIARHAAGLIASTNPGDDVQCSLYWHPTLIDRNPLGDGVDRIKKVKLIPLYYEIFGATLAKAATYIDFPLSFGYVNGQNMDDPWDLRIKAAVAAANAANAAAGGPSNAYSYSGNGFVGWFCNSPAGVQRGPIQNNIDDLDCQAGDTLIGEIDGTGCADGHNLYSPSGYDHVIPFITVTAANGTFQDVCPKGWYKIPRLIFKPQWVLHSAISSAVANDAPYLSSDSQFQTKARADASRCITATEGSSSATVCAPAGASTFVCKAGCSFHNDYIVAWMRKYLRRAFRHCLAIPWTDNTETGLDADQTTLEGTACDSNTLQVGGSGTGSQLNSANITPAPTDAQVDGDHIEEYYPAPVPKGHMGPSTMPRQ
jgi:hypothetical protein